LALEPPRPQPGAVARRLDKPRRATRWDFDLGLIGGAAAPQAFIRYWRTKDASGARDHNSIKINRLSAGGEHPRTVKSRREGQADFLMITVPWSAQPRPRTTATACQVRDFVGHG
jgi:hypothetical protein